jgi:hypothetical protein
MYVKNGKLYSKIHHHRMLMVNFGAAGSATKMWVSFFSDTYLSDSHSPPVSPLKGEKPYAFALFWTKTLPVFPPLQGEGRVGVG